MVQETGGGCFEMCCYTSDLSLVRKHLSASPPSPRLSDAGISAVLFLSVSFSCFFTIPQQWNVLLHCHIWNESRTLGSLLLSKTRGW